LQAHRPISITLEGGFNAAYSANTGRTIIRGTVTMQQGNIIFEKITVY